MFVFRADLVKMIAGDSVLDASVDATDARWPRIGGPQFRCPTGGAVKWPYWKNR
jgi:hypothetical protein